MAHHAKVETGIVTQVIVTMDSDEDTFSDRMLAETGETWIRTSYNGRIRYNYTGIGYVYDSIRDAFIAPKNFNSWVLDEATCQWKAPIKYPNDGKDYQWNESELKWDSVDIPI